MGVLDSGDAYLPRTATCICMGRRPETREVYKRNETEVDGWKREGRDGGVKGTSHPGMHISSGRHVYAWVAVQKRGKSIREMRRR